MRISKCEGRNLYGREKRLLCVLDSDEQLANNSGPSSTTVNTSCSITQPCDSSDTAPHYAHRHWPQHHVPARMSTCHFTFPMIIDIEYTQQIKTEARIRSFREIKLFLITSSWDIRCQLFLRYCYAQKTPLYSLKRRCYLPNVPPALTMKTCVITHSYFFLFSMITGEIAMNFSVGPTGWFS